MAKSSAYSANPTESDQAGSVNDIKKQFGLLLHAKIWNFLVGIQETRLSGVVIKGQYVQQQVWVLKQYDLEEYLKTRERYIKCPWIYFVITNK